jgi:AcrR family transcriptional regulator
MAWDTQLTRDRLLDAAQREFSAHGFSGARIDRIGTTAGVNKERIYTYFGNKSALFEAVITSQLVSVLDDIPLDGTGAEAVARFAGAYFDVSVTRPGLARLASWEGLEREEPVGIEQRSLHASKKVAQIEQAVPGIDRRTAQDLLLTIVTLCHGWVAGANLGLVITGECSDDDRRRRHILATIRAMVESQTRT